MSTSGNNNSLYSALFGAALGAVAGIAAYKAVVAQGKAVKHAVSAPLAPKAIGPYSHACKAGDLVFVSGSIGVDPATGEFAGPDVASQAEQVLTNMKNILAAAGCTMHDVVKTTILLADMSDFATVNAIYEKHFAGAAFPARATFAVKGLPKGALVEIESIALSK